MFIREQLDPELMDLVFRVRALQMSSDMDDWCAYYCI